MPLGLFLFIITPPSGRGLVIPVFFLILVVSFATQARAFILSDRNIFYTPGGETTAGSNAPGAFLVFLFFRGHLPQTPGFRSARQILAVSFTTRARTCILSDLNKFYTRRGGRTTAGSNAPGAFPFFFWWSLAPDLRFLLGETNTSSRRSVNISNIFSRLASIRQNLHEKQCGKLLAIEWHKTLFDESEEEDAIKL